MERANIIQKIFNAIINGAEEGSEQILRANKILDLYNNNKILAKDTEKLFLNNKLNIDEIDEYVSKTTKKGLQEYTVQSAKEAEITRRMEAINDHYNAGNISEKDAIFLSKYSEKLPIDLMEKNINKRNEITRKALEALKNSGKDYDKELYEAALSRVDHENFNADEWMDELREFNIEKMKPEELKDFIEIYRNATAIENGNRKEIEQQAKDFMTGKISAEKVIADNLYYDEPININEKHWWIPSSQKNEIEVEQEIIERSPLKDDVNEIINKNKLDIESNRKMENVQDIKANIESGASEKAAEIKNESATYSNNPTKDINTENNKSTAESIAKNKLKENGGFFSKPMIGGAITLGSIAGIYGFVSGGDQAEKRGNDLGGQVAGSLAGTALYGAGVGGASLGVMSVIKGFKGVGAKA